MNCCTSETTALQEDIADKPEIETRTKCSDCAGVSRFVTKKTMFLMLKPELFERTGEGQYFFCADTECPTVYFLQEQETTFSKEDLRVRVGVKEKEAPRPLCYCYGTPQSQDKNSVKLRW